MYADAEEPDGDATRDERRNVVRIEGDGLIVYHGVLSRANCMHSDAASQGGSWWQGCDAAYLRVEEARRDAQ